MFNCSTVDLNFKNQLATVGLKMRVIKLSEIRKIKTIPKFLYHNCFVLFVTFIVRYINHKNVNPQLRIKANKAY